MCTCIKILNNGFYFGRNLDLEYNFGEKVVITPRNYKWKWRDAPAEKGKFYALIGMANVTDNYPLYADACNEEGLCMAGLNFPETCFYHEKMPDRKNVAPFEFIPYILTQCKDVAEAEVLLKDVNLWRENFSEKMPAAPLHFMIADSERCIVVESQENGLNLYNNEVNVLTNNPPFPNHLYNLENYANLSVGNLKEGFDGKFKTSPYGQGLGAYGLPGDMSPMSRFVRAAFYTFNFQAEGNEISTVSEFFHILDNVAMTRGSVLTPEGKWDITTYSSCMHADEGRYFYKTYNNRQINVVSMFNSNLDTDMLKVFELEDKENIKELN